MGATTIEWAHFTMNPWIGCSKISEECTNCYAESGSKRLAAQHGLHLWDGDRYFTSEAYWKQPAKWNRAAERDGVRRRVFCASYADVFEDREDLHNPRARLLRLIPETPWLDWLLLTKRPESMVRLAYPVFGTREWPSNAWAGTTVGVRSSLGRAIDLVKEVPASTLFLSVEPLLEAVDLDPPVCQYCWGLEVVNEEDGATPFCPECESEMCFGSILDPLNGGVSWVIVGGESGPHARPFDLAWARAIKRQCDDAGVAFFFKQAGSNVLDGGEPVRFVDRKGGNLEEMPLDLRVREFPAGP